MHRRASNLSRLTSAATVGTAWLVLCATVFAQAPGAEHGRVVGIGFVGRMVADLDQSVAHYKTLGFSQDPAADSAWRRDEVAERLYSVGYVGFEVEGLDDFLPKAISAGARRVSNSGIVTMTSGTREIMLRDPDVGGFV